jgi:hypothetical protein
MPAGGAVEEAGVAADLGHHYRLAGRGHLAGDPFAHSVSSGLAVMAQADAGADLELAGTIIQEGDRSSHGPTAASQGQEHSGEPGLKVQVAGECLTHVHQSAELPRLTGVAMGP